MGSQCLNCLGELSLTPSLKGGKERGVDSAMLEKFRAWGETDKRASREEKEGARSFQGEVGHL